MTATPPSGRSGLVHAEPLLRERSRPGRTGHSLPPAIQEPTQATPDLPTDLLRRSDNGLPELDEPTVVRHYTRLSQWNHGIDTGMYPLGSCTMKYNPRINEALARLPAFARLHPLAPPHLCQGALRLIHDLAKQLAEISGFHAVTLQPAAGAHGELCGVKMIRAHFNKLGEDRKWVLIPDTAHGTNPASSALSGYKVKEIKSGPDGIITPEAVASVMDEEVAALMVTNPNTLGLFESHIEEIARIVHAKGGLVYADGANLNALLGIARPGDMGLDVMQFNLHKTFATPHGGGGPGSGPVGVSKQLEAFLPVPRVVEEEGRYRLERKAPDSIGPMKGFYGNFAVMLRAYAYIRELGPAGLKQATEMAVLNANYLRACLEDSFHLPYPRRSMHEVVFSDKRLEPHGVSTLDLAKRLLDHGFHPPTVYFPLVVAGAIMIEPTESESKETLDEFIATMRAIVQEVESNPEVLHQAPTKTIVGRLDEVAAARHPRLTWFDSEEQEPA